MNEPLELFDLDSKYKVLAKKVTFTLTLSQLKSVMDKNEYRELVSKISYPEDKTFSVTVPRGYISDLQTLPEWFTNRFNVKSKWRKAFLLQDFLYETVTAKSVSGQGIDALDQLNTKSLADAIAVCALRALGMGWIRRKVLHSVFKRTSIDKGERQERRGIIIYLLRNRHRVGLTLKQRTALKSPGAPIVIPEPYRVFVPEHVGVETNCRRDGILVYPNITIPLYIKRQR